MLFAGDGAAAGVLFAGDGAAAGMLFVGDGAAAGMLSAVDGAGAGLLFGGGGLEIENWCLHFGHFAMHPWSPILEISMVNPVLHSGHWISVLLSTIYPF